MFIVSTLLALMGNYAVLPKEHPDSLDVIKWVLFDARTLAAYEKVIGGTEK